MPPTRESTAAAPKPTRKTVFVIGAGASSEVKLPTGAELTQSIAKALEFRFEHGQRIKGGDDCIFHALHMVAAPSPDINPYLSACRHIHDAMPQAISIDDFIESRSPDKHIELCGKLAIVRTILEAESKSSLFIEPLQNNRQLKYADIQNTWFRRFLHLLIQNCKLQDLGARLQSVALIIFNYDRCVEQYLYYAFQNYYQLAHEEVVPLIRGLEIHHPYGSVGTLPGFSGSHPIEYGATPDPRRLQSLSSQIKTFTEVSDKSSMEMQAIRSLMQSPRLVFLGFAFHRMNMDLLLPSVALQNPNITRHVFGTAHGLSANNAISIAEQLACRAGASQNNIHIDHLKCNDLLGEYSHNLSLV